jgi:superfamily II DNA or RNA helicase
MEEVLMPKAIISNRIVLELTEEQSQEIKKKLTYKFPIYTSPGAPQKYEVVRTYKNIRTGVLSLPQGRIDLIPEGHEIVDRRVFVPVEFPEPKIPMRNSQPWVYEQVIDSCIIQAKVGWGKTFAALHIAKKLGQKTVVIVTNITLLNQWAEQVEKLYGFKPSLITDGKCDYSQIISIANIQSAVKFDEFLADKFGTIIIDEVHHCPATTFTGFLNSSKARYRLGLSGTLRRKDGKHSMFSDYFTDTRIIPDHSDETLAPKIIVVKTGITLRGTCWANKINNLLKDEEFIHFVAKLAKLYSHMGHTVLLPSERVDFSKRMQLLLGDEWSLVLGAGIAERKQVLKDLADGNKKGLIATRSIVSEGFSEDRLSCLLLITPINNDILLEQIIGRVQRKFPGKMQPIVVDFNFAGHTAKAQNNNRLAFYVSKGWEVEFR